MGLGLQDSLTYIYLKQEKYVHIPSSRYLWKLVFESTSLALREAAEAEAYSLAEYDFITSIEVLSCEDAALFNNSLNPIFN